MDYEILEIKPMTANIGAEIFGVDLSEPLTDPVIAELRQAITDYQVVFFRDQHIDHDGHKTLGKAFGELAIHSGVAGLADHPEIVAIHADANSKFIAGDNWHSDLTCNEIPPMGSILYLHTVPEVGGDTLFASMYAAYDALSDRMKDYLEGLYAVHDGEHVYRPITNDPDKKFPCNEHPVVRTHPVSGKKGIFVNPSYTTKIVGMRKDESDGILQMLYKHCANPNFQVRFRWQPNSIAFWDNRCTWHLAVWDYFPQTRSGFRVTIAGDKRPA
ncbi:TauD/TfdA dioxygenase family protein [Parvibaculum sp. MBR-TMA-1.3b-4.2]|jgi:taurine dioxygenase